MIETEKKQERVLIVGVELQGMENFDMSMEELASLAKTAGAEVAGVYTQKREKYDSKTFVGSGKLEEIAQMVDADEVSTVVVNTRLSPRQNVNLEEILGVKVIDRMQLILDIFAMRARSHEGKLQVHLAQLKYLLPRLVKYNLKIIFAGKFIWFLLAAFLFFAYFMFQIAWSRSEVNEGVVYNLLMFPCVLLVFYPAVFGIQNDEDSRILEILFGIPDYKYKVWGVRLLMIYVAIFVILIVFSWLATLLLYPVNLLEMSAQLMFPILFFGNLAFMFSTITRSGNGTAVLMIIIGIALLIFSNTPLIERSFWNILLNPFSIPRNSLPVIWESIIIKSRIFLLVASTIWMLIGLLNLQKREKFV